jgi:hypothetical protein
MHLHSTFSIHGLARGWATLLCALLLTACGGGGSTSSSTAPTNTSKTLTVSINGPTSTNEGETITLSATANLNGNLTYTWKQTAGQTVTFTSSNNSINFQAPGVNKNEEITFEVEVSDAANNNAKDNHSISIIDSFNLQKIPTEVSVTSVSTIDSLLQLGYLTRATIQANKRILAGSDTSKSCSNGGLSTTQLIDNDQNTLLSSGDALTISFAECYVEPLKSSVSGAVVINLTSYSSDDTTGEVILNELSIDDEQTITFSSSIDFNFTQSANQNVLTLNIIEPLTILFNNQEVLRLIDFTIVKTDRLLDAKYSLNTNGRIIDSLNNGVYQIEQITPWTGYFNEYPHEGELSIYSNPEDKLTLSSNFVTNSELMNMNTITEPYSFYWTDMVEGAMWAFGNNVNQYAQNFRSDNFEVVGYISPDNIKEFPIGSGLTLLMSRPIATVNASNIFFQTSEWPFSSIPATIEINQSTLTLTPSQSLLPGINYSISGFSLTSTLDAQAYIYPPSITTSDRVVPKINADTLLYRYMDTPTLDGSKSEIKQGSQKTYQWQELTSKGVAFEQPNAAVTEFTVPENTTGDIKIRLTVSNEFGESAYSDITITSLEAETTFLAFNSELGDYIGSGQNKVYTTIDGNIMSYSNLSNPNYVDIHFQGETWWDLNIAAPNGEAITTKKYTDATRYPFQSPTKPGLSFTGNGNGCNESYGEFEVLEISYSNTGELSSLAVNFTQHCEQLTAPALRGIVRFNSNAKINP